MVHHLYFRDCSYSLLADDVLGSYLLCPHPKKPKCGSLIVRLPSGLTTYLIENTRKGKFQLEVTALHPCQHLIIDFRILFYLSFSPLSLSLSLGFLLSVAEMQVWIHFHGRTDWTLHRGSGWAAMSVELCPGKPLLWVGGSHQQTASYKASQEPNQSQN